MNKKVLIGIADGTEELEAVTIIDVLRRAEVDVTVAARRHGEFRRRCNQRRCRGESSRAACKIIDKIRSYLKIIR